MQRYIPPHLRPDYKPATVSVVEPKQRSRGVHYKSDQTGLYTSNESWHRYAVAPANLPAPTRTETAKTVSRALARRTLKANPRRKSILKSDRSNYPKRQTRSVSPKHKNPTHLRPKSR
jgi:hypothetical protein